MSRTVTVIRQQKRMTAKNAVFSVYIDGKKVFSLENGDRDEVVVSSESHTIQVINDTTLDKNTGEKTKDTQYTDVLEIPEGDDDVSFFMELHPLRRRTLKIRRI